MLKAGDLSASGSNQTLQSNDGLTPQEKYEYLSEYGTHILCLLTDKKGCTYLSRNFETITGLSCTDQLGENLFNTIHGDHQARVRESLTRRILENKPQQLRCKMKHADGKWYWYQFLIHPKHSGTEGEYVCVVENIHDSIQTQNILQKAKLEAELALRSRSEFLANMSHELRTPLNAVIGFSQIIESGIFGKIENQQYMEYIRHIQESGYDLLAKIEDLLEIANIDAGRVTLTKEEVFMGEIMQHVIDTQMHHANAARVFLEFKSAQKDPLLYVDRLKLQHILGHLVSNAIKFSPQGARITLKAALVAQGLEICVQDTGAGIPADKLDAIVTALQEDNCWTTANEQSTIGLGLALTREFVALHGGQVSVTSKTSEGTTIIISLPKECIREEVPAKTEFLRQAAN
jgi:PAS domain S-box-containing protein